MAARVVTVAFQGVEARRVDVEAQFTGGEVRFYLVGMGDKAISESRERVRAAFSGLGLSLPSRRIIVNLAPADLRKEGSHYDSAADRAGDQLAGMGVIPLPDALEGWAAVGELSLDGRITTVAGRPAGGGGGGRHGPGPDLPGGLRGGGGLGGRDPGILAAPSLIALVNHFRGTQMLAPPRPGPMRDAERAPDLREVKGQENAKRALEIAAAGGHNLALMTSTPPCPDPCGPGHLS